jgi:hypothetical protein
MPLTLTTPIMHRGLMDGSAGIAVSPDAFIIVSDEVNHIMRFSSDAESVGEMALNLNERAAFPKRVKDGVAKEADIEGAARVGEVIFWISSHARNSKGQRREEREVLFATRCTATGVLPLGIPYTRLMEDFRADERLRFLQPFMAAEIAPKEKGGFNIEALCAEGERLFIGFRNPIIEGKALLLPLENAREMVRMEARAVLGEPIFLDLGGLGFRDLMKWRDGFLILAGDYRDRFEDPEAMGPKLFWWSGSAEDNSPLELEVDLLDLNPETVLVFGDERVLLLSDDGKWKPETGKKRFRSAWLIER